MRQGITLLPPQDIQPPRDLEDSHVGILTREKDSADSVQGLAKVLDIPAEDGIEHARVPLDGLADVVSLRRGHVAAVVQLARRHFPSGQHVQRLSLGPDFSQSLPDDVAVEMVAVRSYAEDNDPRILQPPEDVPDVAEAQEAVDVQRVYELRDHEELTLAGGPVHLREPRVRRRRRSQCARGRGGGEGPLGETLQPRGVDPERRVGGKCHEDPGPPAR
mmetsp:Transcript_24765/g.71579  ORF Transcript_24765/g.71579 Transcript_24765/m.71579 type:complete len:218 (+) Transcript_24765:439-1092(+)